MHLNDLIVELSGTPLVLKLNDRFVNNADDMVRPSPTLRGLRHLVSICEKFASDHNLTYNVKKTKMVIFRFGKGPNTVPSLFLDGKPIEVVETFRYLGHFVTSNLKDESDIECQRRALCVVDNMIGRKYYKSSPDVKVTFYRSFCQIFYNCQLWTDYNKKSIIIIAFELPTTTSLGKSWIYRDTVVLPVCSLRRELTLLKPSK